MPQRLLALLSGGLLLLLLAPALAGAAAVTVDLRIEGKARTLYEGRVTTDIRTIDVHDGTGPHRCDGTNNGANPTAGPTRGAAFAAGADGPGGFAFTGQYFASFDDVVFNEVAGENVAFDPETSTFLAEWKNGVFATRGSCQDQIVSGDRVLYAVGDGSEQVLALNAPARVRSGDPATVRVTNDATGVAVAGADVAGRSTGADGTAQVPVAEHGETALKAVKPGAIRSNRAVVCATDGADGFCGTTAPDGSSSPAPPAATQPGAPEPGPTADATPDREAPHSFITSIREMQSFARAKAPRELRGTIGIPTRSPAGGLGNAGLKPDRSGLLTVKLRLTRNDRGRCTYFSGRSERFRRPRDGRCGASNGFWFAIGDRADWRYLLPERLARGRYVLDVNAVDKAGNRDDARRRSENRVVFRVR